MRPWNSSCVRMGSVSRIMWWSTMLREYSSSLCMSWWLRCTDSSATGGVHLRRGLVVGHGVDVVGAGGQLAVRVEQRDGQRRVQAVEGVTHEADQAAAVVAHEGGEPALRGSVLHEDVRHTLLVLALGAARALRAADGVQLSQHDRRVLARQLVLGLAQVAHFEALAGPEVQQVRGEAEGGAEPVQQLGGALSDGGQQGRQLGLGLDLLALQALRGTAGGLQVGGVGTLAFTAEQTGSGVEGVHSQLALEIGDQKVDRSGSIAHLLHIGVSGDSHHARTRQRRELVVVELLGDGPGDEVAGGLVALGQLALHALLRDAALEGHLHHAQHIGQHGAGGGLGRCGSRGSGFLGAQQHKQAVRGGVGEHLQVVGGVLVVRRGVEGPHALQQRLSEGVVGEQGVSVDHVQVAVLGGRHHTQQARRGISGGLHAQKVVQPLFNGVAGAVTDGRGERQLREHSHVLC
eukprot:Colp12_sorted_trinity150504_noHs@15704